MYVEAERVVCVWFVCGEELEGCEGVCKEGHWLVRGQGCGGSEALLYGKQLCPEDGGVGVEFPGGGGVASWEVDGCTGGGGEGRSEPSVKI